MIGDIGEPTAGGAGLTNPPRASAEPPQAPAYGAHAAASSPAPSTAVPKEQVAGAFVSEPLMVGLPAMAVGLLVLGITFVDEIVPSSRALGGVVPVIVFGSGLVLLFATIWAATQRDGLVAAIFGAMAGFTLSLAALLLGIVHNWYAISAVDVAGTEEMFFIVWACVFLFLILPCLRMPPIISLMVAFMMAFLVLLTAGIYTNTHNLLIAGGSAALTVSFLCFYGFVAAGVRSSRRQVSVPVGRPLL